MPGDNARPEKRRPCERQQPARAEQALREAKADLERQVEERTRELSATNLRLTKEIEEHRRADEERRRVEAVARGRERLAVLGELAAGIAHELRNPLQGTIGYLDLARMKVNASQELTPLLERVEEGLHQMDRVAAQLLELARPDTVPTTATPFEPILDRAWAFLQLLAGKQRVALKRSLDPHRPLLEVNPVRIAEVLMNLFRNSLDACPGGGTITVEARLSAKHPEVVEVRVSDTGPGIPTEIRNRVFDPFFTTKPIGKGTGLGLATAKRIVEGCGGHVALVDTGLPGTTISLNLPVASNIRPAVDRNGGIIA